MNSVLGLQRFTLTEDHVKLLRRSNVNYSGHCEWGYVGLDCKRPFGNGDLVGDMAKILGIEPVPTDDGEETVAGDTRKDDGALSKNCQWHCPSCWRLEHLSRVNTSVRSTATTGDQHPPNVSDNRVRGAIQNNEFLKGLRRD